MNINRALRSTLGEFVYRFRRKEASRREKNYQAIVKKFSFEASYSEFWKLCRNISLNWQSSEFQVQTVVAQSH